MTAQPLKQFSVDRPVTAPRAERRPVTLTASVRRTDGSMAELTIVDLSYDGCGVTCAAELRAGERIILNVANRGELHATVAWYAAGQAGLSFADEPGGEAERAPMPRRHARVSVAGEAWMRRSGKLNFRVHLYDLTPEGCKAEFVERPELHEKLWIKFDQLEAVESEVRWIAGPKVGLSFARSIHPAVFDLLLARLGVAPQG